MGPQPTPLRDTLRRARACVAQWVTDDPVQAPRILGLAADLARLQGEVDAGALTRAEPWDGLVRFAERMLSLEGQEFAVSLVLEPHAPTRALSRPCKRCWCCSLRIRR